MPMNYAVMRVLECGELRAAIEPLLYSDQKRILQRDVEYSQEDIPRLRRVDNCD
jgi:hypothetical protein